MENQSEDNNPQQPQSEPKNKGGRPPKEKFDTSIDSDYEKQLSEEVKAITGKPLVSGWEKLVIVKLQPKGRNQFSGKLIKPACVVAYSVEQFNSAIWNPNRKDKSGNPWPLNNLNAYTGFTAEQDPDNANDLSKILHYPKA